MNDKLTNFWAAQGCLIQQGHDVEVGAGTITGLKCLDTKLIQGDHKISHGDWFEVSVGGGEELSALMASILDRAFRGEL